jgi:hypothetical protein
VSGRSNQERIARILTISGIATIVVAAVLAVAVEPILGAIALVGVADLVLARMFMSGRFARESGTAVGGDALGAVDAVEASPADPSADPSENPDARED